MLSGDRLICGFITPNAVGEAFMQWPLHVTIVAWFRLDDDSATIARGLATALTTIKPFTVEVDTEAWFGPKKNRKAHVLKTPASMFEIEKRVRSYLHKKRAWLVDETTKRPHKFLPHVTVQASNELRIGDTFTVDRLYIVEQKGDHKLITEDIAL